MTLDDAKFVTSSWFTSYWKLAASKHMSWDVYSAHQDLRTKRMLKNYLVHVSYFEEAPDEILGWVCASDDTLHYLYVKSPYRNTGIGGSLLRPGLKFYSHQTNKKGREFLEKRNIHFNPYTLEHS